MLADPQSDVNLHHRVRQYMLSVHAVSPNINHSPFANVSYFS